MVENFKGPTAKIKAKSRQNPNDSPREIKKKKNVHFEIEQPARATSELVVETNVQWAFVADCFNLPDEKLNDCIERKQELLSLCNFHENKEKQFKWNDSNDDSDIFAEQDSRTPGDCNPSVSSLRLTSMLHLQSRQNVASQFQENDKSYFPLLLDDKEDIEKAYQGVLPCSNVQKASTSPRPQGFLKSEAQEVVSTKLDDFWADVEFS